MRDTMSDTIERRDALFATACEAPNHGTDCARMVSMDLRTDQPGHRVMIMLRIPLGSNT